MKLSSFEGANMLIVTSGPHGSAQNNCAFDFGWAGTNQIDRRLYAPCDGEVFTHVIQPDGDQYFDFSIPDNGTGQNIYIQFVHDKPVRKGKFKKGELLGESVKDHHHVAIRENGNWHWIFDYMDRNTALYWWNYPNQDSKWARWTTYPVDLQLPDPTPPVDPCSNYKLEIVELKKEIIRLQEKINKAIIDLT